MRPALSTPTSPTKPSPLPTTSPSVPGASTLIILTATQSSSYTASATTASECSDTPNFFWPTDSPSCSLTHALTASAEVLSPPTDSSNATTFINGPTF